MLQVFGVIYPTIIETGDIGYCCQFGRNDVGFAIEIGVGFDGDGKRQETEEIAA
jgi:hypothetical protein